MRWPDYPFNTWTEHWTEHLRQVLLFCRWAFAGNRTGVTQVTHFWATCLTPEASFIEPVPTSSCLLSNRFWCSFLLFRRQTFMGTPSDECSTVPCMYKFTYITPLLFMIYLYSVPVLHLYCVVTDTCTAIISNTGTCPTHICTCVTPVLLLTYLYLYCWPTCTCVTPVLLLTYLYLFCWPTCTCVTPFVDLFAPVLNLYFCWPICTCFVDLPVPVLHLYFCWPICTCVTPVPWADLPGVYWEGWRRGRH